MRLIYLWTTRFILAVSMVGILPISNSSAFIQAQSKKKNPAQASKYAKRGSSKAKKKDYSGALSDYKKAYQLNPSSNYKKKVQQLTSLAKKQGSRKSSSKKPSKKQVAQASAYAKRGNSKAKKKIMQAHLRIFRVLINLIHRPPIKKRFNNYSPYLKKVEILSRQNRLRPEYQKCRIYLRLVL